jgi:hypothetical protein
MNLFSFPVKDDRPQITIGFLIYGLKNGNPGIISLFNFSSG